MAIFEEVNILPLVSANASFNSNQAQVKNEGYAVHIQWKKTEGTLAGSVKLQAKAGVNLPWADVANSSVNLTDVTDDTGVQLWNLEGQHYNYFRIAVTISTGTGTFEAYYSSKEV